jgi:hypothetical protein
VSEFQVAVSLKAPDDVQAVVTIVSNVGALRRLLKHMDDHTNPIAWPSGDLRRALRDAITKADTTVWGLPDA